MSSFRLAVICCCLPVLLAADGPGAVAYLGVAAKPAGKDTTGLAVTFVDPDGPAGAAGARTGDVIEMLDDQLLVNAPQMVALVHLHRPGDRVTLTVRRDGRSRAVTVTLGGRMSAGDVPPPPIPSAVGPDEAVPGITFAPVVIPPATVGPLGGATAVRYADATYAATVTTDVAGHRTMVVTSADGRRAVASGPIDTPVQWAAFPADVRQHLRAVEAVLSPQPGTRP